MAVGVDGAFGARLSSFTPTDRSVPPQSGSRPSGCRGVGFQVSLKRCGFDGFMPAGRSRDYYPSILDALGNASEHKLPFRGEKRPG